MKSTSKLYFIFYAAENDKIRCRICVLLAGLCKNKSKHITKMHNYSVENHLHSQPNDISLRNYFSKQIIFSLRNVWLMFLLFTKLSKCKHSNIFNPSNAELNLICHLPALLAAQHILHVSRIRVKVFRYSVIKIYK